MKHIISAFCIGIFIIFSGSCKKENHNNSPSILGTWELRHMDSGMPSVNYPSGNGNILKFTDTTYQVYLNGQLKQSGHYLIISDTTVNLNTCGERTASQFPNRIIYDNDSISDKKFIQISNNVLSIVSGCFTLDYGVLMKYERQ